MKLLTAKNLAMKHSLSFLFCLLALGAVSYANTNSRASNGPQALYKAGGVINGDVNERLLQTFKNTFPDAQEVQWKESPDKYTVNFKAGGLVTLIEYDKDGEFMSSVRYYSESNLPVNILCKLHKKYPEKKVFGVTEKATESNVEYFIKLEDATTWVTVKSSGEGSMSVVEKFKKANP
jgi:hypothetical protein